MCDVRRKNVLEVCAKVEKAVFMNQLGFYYIVIKVYLNSQAPVFEKYY